MGRNGEVIKVHERQITSIIAYSLSTNFYHTKLQEYYSNEFDNQSGVGIICRGSAKISNYQNENRSEVFSKGDVISAEFIHKFPLELFRMRKKKIKLGLIQHEYNKKEFNLLRDKVTYFILNKDILHKIPKMELFVMYCGCGIFLYTINDIVSLKNIRYAKDV